MYDISTNYWKGASATKIKSDLLLFSTNMQIIIMQLQEKNISITLQKPLIYDQTVQSTTPNMIGRNDILSKVATVISDMGKKYSLQVFDYGTIMRNINIKLQKDNPSDSIVGSDRIHPGPPGHMVMAYKFLNNTEKHSLISHMVLHEDVATSQQASHNCLVHSLIRNISSNNSLLALEAVITELALPFVFSDDQRKALALVPFVKDFNMEVLKVRGLDQNPPGGKEIDYKLSIDGVKMGLFSSGALAYGINLAAHKRTPQHIQAANVRKVLMELWELEDQERTIKFVEYCCMHTFFENKSSRKATDINMNDVQVYLNEYYAKRHPNVTFYKNSFDKYLVVKKNEDSLFGQMEALRAQARAAAAPIQRKYILLRKI